MNFLCSVCGRNESVAHDRCGGFRKVSDVREEITSAILDAWRVMRPDETFLEASRRFADAALLAIRADRVDEVTKRIIAAYSGEGEARAALDRIRREINDWPAADFWHRDAIMRAIRGVDA